MNRTRRLMTAVTASLLFNGAGSMNGALVLPQSQAAPQQDDSWKTDAKVEKAAKSILDYLSGTTEKDAKTQEDVLKKFPELDSDVVGKALKRLIWTGDIRRAGDGTQNTPFSYFALEGVTG